MIRGTHMKRIESINLDRKLALAPVPFSGATGPPDARVSTGFATELTNLLKAVDQETTMTDSSCHGYSGGGWESSSWETRYRRVVRGSLCPVLCRIRSRSVPPAYAALT